MRNGHGGIDDCMLLLTMDDPGTKRTDCEMARRLTSPVEARWRVSVVTVGAPLSLSGSGAAPTLSISRNYR